MSEFTHQLSNNLDRAQWEWLIPHVKRDAVVVVHQQLDLVEVGEALASDNVSSVQRWISEQLIGKPSSEQLSDWNQNSQKEFQTLIVQPFVLIQEIPA